MGLDSPTRTFGRPRFFSERLARGIGTRSSLAIGSIAVATLFLTLALYRFSYDDAYITFRYAYNLATGAGFVYNPQDAHLGTTAPLYGLVLGVLGILSPEAIPLLGGWLSGFALFAIGLAIFVYSRRRAQNLVGWVAGLLFVFSPLTGETFGGETTSWIALVLWAFVLYDREQYCWTGLVLALATLTRPDAALATAVIGLHYLIRKRRLPWKMASVFLLVLLPWLLYAFSHYGSFLPDTLGAKTAQVTSGRWQPFGQGLLDWATMYLGRDLVVGPAPDPIYRLYLLFPLLGIPGLVLQSRVWGLPLLWTLLHLMAYWLIGVPFYYWYLAPALLGLAILGGITVEVLTGILSKLVARVPLGAWVPFRTGVQMLVPSLLILPIMGETALRTLDGQLAIQHEVESRRYRPVGEWIAAATPPTATVGYVEIGYLGYYSRRPMVDPLGLVTPQAIPHVRAGDLDWAYYAFPPDFLVVNPDFDWLGFYTKEKWFESCYRLVTTIQQLGIFQKDCAQTVMSHTLDLTQVRNETIAGDVLPDRTVGQTFVARRDGLRGVGLLLATYRRNLRGPLLFHLRSAQGVEHQADLVTVEAGLSEIRDNTWHVFRFPPIAGTADQEFYAYLEAPSAEPGRAMTVWSTAEDVYPSGTAMLNGVPAKGDLAFILDYE